MSEPVFSEVLCVTCGSVIGSRILAFSRVVRALQGEDTYNYQTNIPFVWLANDGSLSYHHRESTTVVEKEESNSLELTPTGKLVERDEVTMKTKVETTTDELVTPIGQLLTAFGAHRMCCRQALMCAYVYPKNF
jgi:DNA-directed RNA polymerase subunit N (RpoN/RPB10)